MGNTKIKLFITYKDRHRLIESDVITPIQTGRAIADEIFEEMIGDDTGDNISEHNPKYCELSAQYWVWKNYEKIGNPDYIGFMHYRRLLNFNENTDVKFFEQYEENLWKNLENFTTYDAILPIKLPAYSPTLKRNAKNLREQWDAEYNISELDMILKYISEKYPDMQNAIDVVMSKDKSYWYNIFTMKKELFNEYCAWLFDVLKHSENIMTWNRAQGFLAERMFNIFIEYKKQEDSINFIELPIFRPLEQQYNSQRIKDIVPIVLISSNEYVPHTTTTINSVISNTKNKKDLYFYILSDGISNKNKNILSKFVFQKGCKIEIVDIKEQMLEKFKKANIPSHIKTTTFLKLLIPEIMPQYDKILYLDSDLMARKDISELQHLDFEENLLALAEDVANTLHSKRLFGVSSSNYYNAGVILFNASRLRQINYFKQILTALENNFEHYILADQDLINDVFSGKIKSLDAKWNHHHKWHDKLPYYQPENPKLYQQNIDNPSIVHYLGLNKIWFNVEDRPFKNEYFKYWRETPFYNFFRINKYNDYQYNVYRINLDKFVLFEKKENSNKLILKFCGIKLHLRRNKNYLYSRKYCNGRKIINILGVKFKFFSKKSVHDHINELQNNATRYIQKREYDLAVHWKSRFFSCYQKGHYIKADSLQQAFIKSIDCAELAAVIKNYLGYADLSRFHHNEVLMYINLLLKSNNKISALNVLNQYFSIFGYQDIHRYFEVANLAVEMGVTDEQVLKAAELYQTMIENREKFKRLVKNKTIALVGNGPYELGRGRGNEIDSHDIVIRLNNYKTEGFETDYGSRTDIWARGMGGIDVADKSKTNMYKAVLYANDYSQFPVLYNLFETIKETNEKGIVHTFIESNVFNQSRVESKIFFPTTGFNTIMFLLKSCKIKSLNYYGFQFLENTFDKKATHYFNDRSTEETIIHSACHELDAESKYLKSLLYNNHKLKCKNHSI